MNRIEGFRKSGLLVVTLVTAFLLNGCGRGGPGGARAGGRQMGGRRVGGGAPAGRFGGGPFGGGALRDPFNVQLGPQQRANQRLQGQAAQAQQRAGQAQRDAAQWRGQATAFRSELDGANRRLATANQELGTLRERVRRGEITAAEAARRETALKGDVARLTTERDRANARVATAEQRATTAEAERDRYAVQPIGNGLSWDSRNMTYVNTATGKPVSQQEAEAISLRNGGDPNGTGVVPNQPAVSPRGEVLTASNTTTEPGGADLNSPTGNGFMTTTANGEDIEAQAYARPAVLTTSEPGGADLNSPTGNGFMTTTANGEDIEAQAYGPLGPPPASQGEVLVASNTGDSAEG